MDIQSIISRLKQYPFFDIEKGGVVVRKQVATAYINAELIADFIREFGDMYFIPKRMRGNSPYQLIEQRIKIDSQGASSPAQQFMQFDHQPAPQAFAGLGNPYQTQMQNNYPQQYQPQQSSGNGDLYKVLYDAKCNELSEANRKLEDERERRHKAELELSGSKNSVVGDIAQGLAGIAPMILQGMSGGAGLAGTPQPAPQPRMQAIQDKRIMAIVKHYAGLDEPSKQGIYEILDALFADTSLIPQMIESLSGTDDYNEE